MDILHEIEMADEKFSGIAELREVVERLSQVSCCVFGSFLSAIHFQRPFSNTFDLLVSDEMEAYDALEGYAVDTLHGTLMLRDREGVASQLKLRIINSTAKNHEMRDYLITHAEARTCIVKNSHGLIEKFDVPVPRRGAALISALIEMDGSPQQTASAVEKIVWSLNHIGVAPLLRESRFVPESCIEVAAGLIEDLFVVHANKTVTILHGYSTGECKNIVASELKKLGRPYAALLRV